jgi:hypothetical protein
MTRVPMISVRQRQEGAYLTMAFTLHEGGTFSYCWVADPAMGINEALRDAQRLYIDLANATNAVRAYLDELTFQGETSAFKPTSDDVRTMSMEMTHE